jgi:hypothetical protein
LESASDRALSIDGGLMWFSKIIEWLESASDRALSIDGGLMWFSKIIEWLA